MPKDAVFNILGSSVEVAELGQGVGEGHITVFGQSYSAIGAGTWTHTAGASYLHYETKNTTAADGDNISWNIYLSKGKYTLIFLYRNGANEGIADFDLDGTEAASIDLYNASDNDGIRSTAANINVTASGQKTLRLRVDGKNGSSGGYNCRFQAIHMIRTGDSS